MNKNIYSLPVQYSNPKQISKLIKEYTVSILYENGNRNGSWFDREVVDQMINSLRGVPIIGKWNEENNDFLDHGELVSYLNNGEVDFKKESLPSYGYVPETAEVWWEKRLDKDSVERDYLCTKVYTWNGRYPQLNVLDEGKSNLSMELDPTSVDGDMFEAEDGKSYFKFTKADFFGLCILGKEVEPCFEGAKFATYSLEDNSNYIANFKLMKEELATALAQYEEEEKEKGNAVTTEVTEDEIVEVEESTTFEEEETSEEEETTTTSEEAEPTITIESLLADNSDLLEKIASLASEKEALENELTTLKDNYSSIEKELNTYKVKELRAQKEEELSKYEKELDAQDYKDLFDNLDTMSIDEIQVQAQLKAYKYMKKLLLDSSKKETSKEKDKSDFSLSVEEEIETNFTNDSWIERVAREIKKNKENKQF